MEEIAAKKIESWIVVKWMLFVIQMIDQGMKISLDQVQKIISKGDFRQLKARNLGKDI